MAVRRMWPRAHRAVSDAFASASRDPTRGSRERREHRAAVSESITLQGARQSGFPDAPFELVGNGAVLDGSLPVPPDAWSYVEGNLFRFRPPKTAFQMLYLDGKPARRREARSPDDLGHLQPLEWCLYQQHVYFRGEANRQPQSYAMSLRECRSVSPCTKCGT